MADSTGFWTIGRIASHLRAERHRVEYVIDARGIRPLGKAGIARVFGPEAVARIGEELRRIDEQRDAARAGGVA